MTPGTSGSSKSLMHTLSFGDSRLKVVLTQGRSSARAVPEATPNVARNTQATATNILIFVSMSVGRRQAASHSRQI